MSASLPSLPTQTPSQTPSQTPQTSSQTSSQNVAATNFPWTQGTNGHYLHSNSGMIAGSYFSGVFTVLFIIAIIYLIKYILSKQKGMGKMGKMGKSMVRR